MRRAVSTLAVAAATGLAAICWAFAAIGSADAGPAPWSSAERALIASMQLSRAGSRPTDPSNAYESRSDAAALGRTLFDDPRLSGNGQVSCASCHAADRQFQDGRAQAQGMGTGRRRTMPVMGAARSAFLFWDGRKDSLWSQALGPLEDAAEHGGNRVRLVRLLDAHYRAAYQKVFGPLALPPVLPQDASPNGTAAERAAWQAMDAPARDAVNRAFANLGKSLAAYERRIGYGESRFDAYARTVEPGGSTVGAGLSAQEVRGLRLFIGKGQCVTCHAGPLFTDQAFHNTGVPPLDANAPDRGRADGVRRLRDDPFNCLGRYSDAPPGQCGELQFLSTEDPMLIGAFRTPSLRNVAERAPYMHAGQFAALEQVVAHYARSPRTAIGRSELAAPDEPRGNRQPIRLSDSDVQDIVAFLRTLSGSVDQPE